MVNKELRFQLLVLDMLISTPYTLMIDGVVSEIVMVDLNKDKAEG